MKALKRLLPAIVALVASLAFAGMAFAAGTGTITVNNAASGETYSIVKIFDATVSDDGSSVAYTYAGDLPDTLSGVFEKVAGTDYVQRKDGVTDEQVTNAAKAYAATQTAAQTKVASGGALVFEDVPYGYYAITSSQGTVVSVDSTNPDAVVYDKNSKEPSAEKTVDKESYSIGDTITYTATFDTANYMGEGVDAKIVTDYVIKDTLPEFLSNVNVTSITVGGTAITTQQFDSNNEIKIPWATKGADGKYTSTYANGAKIVITYTGKLTSVTNVNGADTNTVTITPYVDNGDENPEPWDEDWEASTEVKTYAASLKKVDENDKALPGATFTFKGLVAEKTADGVYTVTSYDPNGAESTALATDATGKLYIVGLASDATVKVTEAAAPDGYNKLTTTMDLTPQVLTHKIYKESGTIYYDADGNVVAEESSSTSSEEVTKNLSDLDAAALKIVNKTGTELPQTGDMGTTILYIIGGALVLFAGVALFARHVARKQS